MVVRKKCQNCKKLKLLDSFDKNTKYSDGHSSSCKDCTEQEKELIIEKPKTMATLKEKRAAEEAAKLAAAPVVTPKATVKKVTKEPVVVPAAKADTSKTTPKEEEVVEIPAVVSETTAPTTPKEKVKIEKLPVPRSKAEKRKINQLDLTTGKVIKTFDTVMDAGKELGKSDAAIRVVLRGDAKQAYGFNWELGELLYPELSQTVVPVVDKAAAKAAAKK